MSLYIKTYEYTKCEAIEGSFYPGKYKLEAWGASASTLSKGAYSSGILTLNKEVKFFITIGSTPGPQSKQSAGGCNGGGKGLSKNYDVIGGGGSTDIRIFENTLNHRILVAGGAGGCQTLNGYGGNSTTSPSYGIFDGTFNEGSFGKGADSTGEGYGGGGGGGGWYGGCSHMSLKINEWGCGQGGSNFALNENSNIPADYALSNMKSIFLTNIIMINGNSSLPNPSSDSNEVGHSGNGAFRITILKGTHLINCSIKLNLNILCMIRLLLMLLINIFIS